MWTVYGGVRLVAFARGARRMVQRRRIFSVFFSSSKVSDIVEFFL